MTDPDDQRITALAAVIREMRPDVSEEFAKDYAEAYALALSHTDETDFSHAHAHSYAYPYPFARAHAREFTDEEKAQIDATYALLFT